MDSRAFYKLVRPLILLCYIVLGILAFKYLMSHVLWWCMPFLIGFIVSRFALPLQHFLNKKLKFKNSISGIIGTVLVILLVFAVTGGLAYFIYLWLVPFFGDLGNTFKNVSASLSQTWDKLQGFLDRFPSIKESVNNAIKNIPGSIDIYGMFGKPLLSAAGGVPAAILSVVATFVSSFFFVIYDSDISAFMLKILKPSLYRKITRTFSQLFSSLFKWVKAQCILCSVCLLELFIGFLILGFKNAFLLAFLIAFIDFLPVLGAGAVLIPWALIALFIGNYKIAIGMLIIYGVVLVVRNLLEPHVVSKNIGMHPFVTLFSIYVGFRMFGFIGMFVVPLVLLTITRMNSWGYIRLWPTDIPPDPESEILEGPPLEKKEKSE